MIDRVLWSGSTFFLSGWNWPSPIGGRVQVLWQFKLAPYDIVYGISNEDLGDLNLKASETYYIAGYLTLDTDARQYQAVFIIPGRNRKTR